MSVCVFLHESHFVFYIIADFAEDKNMLMKNSGYFRPQKNKNKKTH